MTQLIQLMNNIEHGTKMAIESGVAWFAATGVLGSIGTILICLGSCTK